MFEKKNLRRAGISFTGAKVEGRSGFVNLMHIKHRYFEAMQDKLMEEVKRIAPPETAFREELFDKLYSSFSHYFCESGSVYFRHLPAWQRIYERVLRRRRRCRPRVEDTRALLCQIGLFGAINAGGMA